MASVLNKKPKTAKYLPSVVPSVLAHTICNSKGEYLPSMLCSEDAWKWNYIASYKCVSPLLF